MSTLDKSGVDQLAKQIGDLYLSKSFSDVTIVIDGTELPAHRNILSQRCLYFKTMFASGMLESTSKRIELHEIPITGFKSVLKWIYTGEIEFSQMDTALEVYRLSNMYELTELEYVAVDYITDNYSIDNFCLILNSSSSLRFHIDVEGNGSEILSHETFVTLSKDALTVLLNEDYLEDATNIEILEAFVRWMKANPDQSEHFPGLLQLIPITSVVFGELLSIVPSELISANVLADVARLQQLNFEFGGVPDVNFATAKYGATIVIDNKKVFFSDRFLKEIDIKMEEVVIELGQCFKLNYITFNICADPRSVWKAETVSVSVSIDNANWVCINSESEDADRHNNLFVFNDCMVRFIKISSGFPIEEVYKLSTLFAGYTTDNVS